LRSAARNVAHHRADVALFEVARIYEPSGEKLPSEPLMLGAVFLGARRLPNWHSGSEPWDFFAAKGVLVEALRAVGYEPLRFAPASGAPFHPTRAATILLHGTSVGALGELHPDVCDGFGVPEGTVILELAAGSLIATVPDREKVEELPRFPANYIDLALVVEESVPAGRVEELIREAGAPELASVRLFDVYRGEQIGEGLKSLAYALELRAQDRTLTDAEALSVRERIVEMLADRTGAEIRA
jgi:phenylalanyl-tRNA synthetase beta chain